MCESMSRLRINSSARDPIPAAPTPKKTANTTICKISFFAMASKMLTGKICLTNSGRLRLLLFNPVLAAISGKVNSTPMPGCKIFTITKPSNRETKDIEINHAKVFKPTRPIVEASPILAIPTTKVANTNGAIIILIKRKNTSVKMEI